MYTPLRPMRVVRIQTTQNADARHVNNNSNNNSTSTTTTTTINDNNSNNADLPLGELAPEHIGICLGQTPADYTILYYTTLYYTVLD